MCWWYYLVLHLFRSWILVMKHKNFHFIIWLIFLSTSVELLVIFLSWIVNLVYFEPERVRMLVWQKSRFSYSTLVRYLQKPNISREKWNSLNGTYAFFKIWVFCNWNDEFIFSVGVKPCVSEEHRSGINAMKKPQLPTTAEHMRQYPSLPSEKVLWKYVTIIYS